MKYIKDKDKIVSIVKDKNKVFLFLLISAKEPITGDINATKNMEILIIRPKMKSALGFSLKTICLKYIGKIKLIIKRLNEDEPKSYTAQDRACLFFIS